MTMTMTMTAAALTFAERRLRDGGLEGGVLAGLAGDRAAVREARAAWLAFRRAHGFKGAGAILTGPEGQAKLAKSERYALGLTLTPARSMSLDVLRVTDVSESRPVNVCPRASAGCESACLNSSGRGAFDSVQRARQIRHAFVLQHARHAGVLMGSEIRRAVARHGAGNVTFRFNVVSDYRVEFVMPGALAALQRAGVRVYDYTAYSPADREPVHGYALTYSAKEPEYTPDASLVEILAAGGNVAMPFAVRKGDALPESWHGFRVIDGDVSDDRTDDPRGVVVGLRPKGAAGAADVSGFVRKV